MRAPLLMAALPIVLGLAACGSEKSGTFTTDDGESGEYTIDADDGEASATIETEDGTATLRSGENVPVNLPDGFSLYPGAKVVSNTVVTNEEEGSGSMIFFESDDAPEDITKFYKEQAKAAGITIQIDANLNGSQMIAGERESDGTSFMATASRDDGEKTNAQLMIGSELGQ